MATLIDPTTGRTAVSGPNGEAALSAGDPRIRTFPGLVQGSSPDGRAVWYVPGQNISQGNVQALASYQSQLQNEQRAASGQTDSQVSQTTSLLRQLGLQDMIPDVESLVRGGATPAQIENMLYDRSTSLGKKLDQLYPEIRETQEKGLPPINVQNILDARATARQVVNQLGVQDAFPDLNATVRDYLTNGKSIAELQARLVSIGDAVTATAYGDPAHQQELAQWQQYYGVAPTKGELVAMALNSQFTVAQLQERAQTAKIGAAGVMSGFGQIDRTQAEGIAALGVTGDQAIGQFSQLAGIQPAVGELTGQQVDVVGQQAQLDAAFGGNAQAQRRIAKRQREQAGLFESGGGFASGSEGFAVGSAR